DGAREAHHAAPRPHLVRPVTVGDDEIGVLARTGVGEQREDGAVAGFLLLRVQSLAAGALRADRPLHASPPPPSLADSRWRTVGAGRFRCTPGNVDAAERRG